MGLDVLVVNLTRLGDLLQTQPLVSALVASGMSVGALCQENFAGALDLMSGISRRWLLPGGALLADLDSRWPNAVGRLRALGRRIWEEGAPRVIINLTPSLPGRLLASFLAPDPAAVWGFGLDESGFGLNRGSWASFLSAATAGRFHSPFNLVDVMRKIPQQILAEELAGRPGSNVLASPGEAARQNAASLLEAAGNIPRNGGTRGFVAIQPGASAEKRQWPVEYFASVGDRICAEAGLCPVLLGASSERGLGERYQALARAPAVNAIGCTDLQTLAALLERCRLLLTNDTGTMHLAAGLGLPSLSFFLATAQPWDTGPYLAGCCCLEPAMDCHPCAFGAACQSDNACRGLPHPDLASGLALSWLGGNGWACPGIGCGDVRVWISGFDSHGFASLECISGHDGEDRSVWLSAQRDFWRHFLDDLDGLPQEADARGPRRGPRCSAEFSASIDAVFSQAVPVLAILEEQGAMIGRLARAGELFLLNCERLQVILDSSPPFRALGQIWRELRQSRGGELREILEFVSILHRRLAAFAESCANSGI